VLGLGVTVLELTVRIRLRVKVRVWFRVRDSYVQNGWKPYGGLFDVKNCHRHEKSAVGHYPKRFPLNICSGCDYLKRKNVNILTLFLIRTLILRLTLKA